MVSTSSTPSSSAEDGHAADTDQGIADLSETLERLASWVRRVTPRGEFNLVSMATLATIADEGPSRVSDLATRERVSQPGMTGLINRLTDAGLVERRTDPSDGRASLVTVTDAGLAHLHARHAARAQLLTGPLGRLTAAQREALHNAIPALTALTASQEPVPQATPSEHTTGRTGPGAQNEPSEPNETEDEQK